MKRIIDVTGGKGGYVFLLVGDNKTALIDAGMAYCAENLVNNIKQTLQNRDLDYVFISHSHYDHIGAIPFLRLAWPSIEVFGAQHAAYILNKESALRKIKELSLMASDYFHANGMKDYNDQLMKIDHVIQEGDSFDLGNLTVQVIETPGHTKCSLSFLVNNEVLFASESTGHISASGKYYACYLTSYSQAIDSIKKCEEYHPSFIVVPHYGFLENDLVHDYWKNCLEAAEESKNFIYNLYTQGYNKEEIFQAYVNEFKDEEKLQEQPMEAFQINCRHLVNATIKEIINS